MKTSQLDANTYGVGQLITQRKQFAVPEHQRSFAWTTEEVGDYLTDISDALAKDAPDYFIGLIVLLGPLETVWQILDGQQRLATTTMLYAAIREWLDAHNHKADAKQTQDEFIAVRQLGGTLVPRVKLNIENRKIFNDYVVGSNTEDAIRQELSRHPKHSSNYRLLEASLLCRTWVADFAANHGGIRQLYKLSQYVESRVKVVCLGVSSESDAFILFESLNARGADLSALDLVKNYIFGHASANRLSHVRNSWATMLEYIEGKDADDFLKVFWTSRFGVIQKLELFNNIRRAYRGAKKVEKLAEELATDAARFYALEDPEHELWIDVGALGRQLVADQIVIGSKQVRPVVLAAMRAFNSKELRRTLWALIVLVLRYQVIGRGRTGILEKQLGNVCELIHAGEISKAADLYKHASRILAETSTFEADFKRLRETKSRRVLYCLLEMEGILRFGKTANVEDVLQLKSLANRISPYHILPRNAFRSDANESDTEFFSFANRCLLEDSIAQYVQQNVASFAKEVAARSELLLTKEIAELGHWPEPALTRRAERLASLAETTWRFENPVYT